MIAGRFDPHSRWPVPLVRATVFLPDLTARWAPVEFVLDTGATHTTLHPADAQSVLGIDLAQLDQLESSMERVTAQGIGGSSTYYVVPAEYGFVHEAGHFQVIRERILVADQSSGNQSLPSVLGWDVLQHFRLELEWARRTVWLL